MSVEGVTDAAARTAALAPNIAAAYSSTGSGQDGLHPIPQDIPQLAVGKGAAIVRHERFELIHTGKPEQIKHYITVELWVGAASAATAEKTLLPLVTQVIAAFRTNTGLFGNATVGKLLGGGPPYDVAVNAKPFLVYPMTVIATELTVNEYLLGPPA